MKMRNRKMLKRIAVAAIILIIVGAVAFTRWRNRQIERLVSNSTVVETAQGLVEYAAVGEGTAVIILHGTIGGYDQLQPMIKLLDTDAYQFIFISRPGYLRTPLSSGETFAEQADLVAALLDELEIDQTAVLAMSGGGPAALQFALRHPDRCWGILMMSANSDGQAGNEQGGETAVSRDAVAQPPEIVTNLLFSDVTSWVVVGALKSFPRQSLKGLVGEAYVDTVLDDAVKRNLYAELADSLALLSRRRAGALNDGIQFGTFTGHPFEEIRAPMLVLHGTNDNAVNILEPRALNEAVPHSEYVEIEGGTHFMLISHYDTLSPLILNFLNAHLP